MSTSYTSLFCEDVRSEVGNKRSFMGIFIGNVCKVPSFPVLFPKLFVVIRTCVTGTAKFPGGSLKIHFDDDEPLLDDRLQPMSSEGDGKFAVSWRDYQFSPFVVQKESRLRILITTDDGHEERLPALKFVLADADDKDVEKRLPIARRPSAGAPTPAAPKASAKKTSHRKA